MEQDIVRKGYWMQSLMKAQLKSYFCDFIINMRAGTFSPQWEQDAIERAQRLVAEAQAFEQKGLPVRAETTIKRLLPPVGILAFRR